MINVDRDPERHPFMSYSLISCLLHSGRGFTDDSTSPSIRQKSSESRTEFEGACPGSTCLMAYTLLFHLIVLTCEDLILDLSPAAAALSIRSDFFTIKTKATCHWTHIDCHIATEVLVQSFNICPSLFFFVHL